MQRIEDCVHFLLGKALQKAAQMSKAKLKDYHITPVQFALLHILWEKDGQHGAELGERLHVDAATITGILDRLEQHGFIERRPDPSDRRVNRIYLTSKGGKLEASLNEKMDEMNDEIFEGFTYTEIVQFKKMLLKIGLNKD
ncbi:MarR family winged helix-turn-helix transcriptional regulator [Aneurinibacillus tyrosinisolvens]|uniref:MarR family winged helix-turn-helix transcriptional regulator n=1 Tax=Aneurinibacillus tyrosinisolvens TaxID=1443435 RepID=UPI00063FD250|nr:MarR family transcriptional regulator [Aneurinibacillus tyrosinisolvens]